MSKNKQKAKWEKENGYREDDCLNTASYGCSPETSSTHSKSVEERPTPQEAATNLAHYGIDLGDREVLKLRDGITAIIFGFRGTTIEDLCLGTSIPDEHGETHRNGHKRTTLIQTLQAETAPLNNPCIDNPCKEILIFTWNVGLIIRRQEMDPGLLDIKVVYMPEISMRVGNNGSSEHHKIVPLGDFFNKEYYGRHNNPHYDICLQVPTILSHELRPSLQVFCENLPE